MGGRKKKAQEVVQVEVEGKHAIDSPGMPKSSEVPPEEYLLEENEERSMIEPKSYENPKLKDLISILIEWVNDELHGERIIVQDVRRICTMDRSCRSCWRNSPGRGWR